MLLPAAEPGAQFYRELFQGNNYWPGIILHKVMNAMDCPEPGALISAADLQATTGGTSLMELEIKSSASPELAATLPTGSSVWGAIPPHLRDSHGPPDRLFGGQPSSYWPEFHDLRERRSDG